MKKRELDVGDKLDSLVICKTMNLEKNIPLVILEVELAFEIKDVTVELATDNLLHSAPQDQSGKAFQYMFYDSAQNGANELNVEQLQNRMGSLVIRDTHSQLFAHNFRENEYLGKR